MEANHVYIQCNINYQMTLIEIYHIFQDKTDHFSENVSELNAMQYLASG